MDYTPEGLKDAKYVIVNVMMKDSKSLETKGYFLGIRPIVDKDFDVAKVDDLYVWVYRKGAVHMFHLDYYYIDEIQVGIGMNANISSTQGFINEDDSQKEAIQNLKDISESLISNEMSNANGLIDYKKYDNVPTKLKDEIELTQAKSTVCDPYNRSGGVNYSAGQRPASSTGSTSTNTIYKSKEVHTTQFKRTTRYDVKEAIEEMNKKVAEIKAGTYEPPQLKHIPADKNKGVEQSAAPNAQQNWEDPDDYGNYPYCCG
jgi:hypothetical protein